MKLAASVIVRNEAGRYLEPCIAHLLEFCDVVCVLDNGSTDASADLCERVGAHVLRDPEAAAQERSLFTGHAAARNRLLRFTLAQEPTHILAIDADEFITDPERLRVSCGESGVAAWGVCMREVWNAYPDRIELRQDGGWVEHDVAMLWSPERVREPFVIVDRGPATGRTPESVSSARMAHSCSSVLHFGWANQAERADRYERYAVADGGRYHAGSHLQSILWPDEKIRLESSGWPDALACYRDAILDRDAASGAELALRHTLGMVENTYESIEAALRPLIVDDETAGEVYSALHDVAWVPLASKAQTYSEAFDLADQDQEPWPFYWNWRSAGDVVAAARGQGETYLDVFWELHVESGVVSERVRRLMASLGLRPVT